MQKAKQGFKYLRNAHRMHIRCLEVCIIFRNDTSLVGVTLDVSRQLGRLRFSREFRGVLTFFTRFQGVLQFFPGMVPPWTFPLHGPLVSYSYIIYMIKIIEFLFKLFKSFIRSLLMHYSLYYNQVIFSLSLHIFYIDTILYKIMLYVYTDCIF